MLSSLVEFSGVGRSILFGRSRFTDQEKKCLRARRRLYHVDRAMKKAKGHDTCFSKTITQKSTLRVNVREV